MLAARAAKTVQKIAGHVIAALHGNLLHRIGHVFDRNGDEAFRHGFRRASIANLFGKLGEACAHGVHIERLVLLGSENGREEVRLQLAQHHIRIGHGQRSATAIAGRAGVCAGRIRAGLQTVVLIMQDRTATGGHGVNAHHWRANAHARHFRVEGAFIFSVIMGHVRRGAAHVEADHLVEAGKPRRLHHADHAAGRAGKDRVLALKLVGRRQAARRHHEFEARAFAVLVDAQFRRHAAYIARQDRRQVGVHHRCVATTHQLDQR